MPRINSNTGSRPERFQNGVPFWDAVFINPYAGRLLFFIFVPGALTLRASCLTLRLCLRIPLEGRLFFTLVFSVGVFTLIPQVLILFFDSTSDQSLPISSLACWRV